MKVLFAVNNENISESIIKKYQQEYKEIISVKNVYYFNAIIKELQRDKTYDRIVISEDLQPFSNNNYDQIDKFIFDKMDNISDEAVNQSGNDIPIILICTDRRAKSEPLLIKLFGIGVYNALIGKDRSITNVCELLARPRTKKEAKVYYRIDSDDVDYKVESEGNVSEVEIQNILNHYKKLGADEQKYVESFDHIANQYTDSQLRLIAKFLPLNVKAVLEANSMRYQEVISFGTQTSKPKSYQPPQLNTTNKNEKTTKQKKLNKKADKKEQVKLDLIEKNLSQNKMTEPVIIPSAINTSKIKKMQEQQSQVQAQIQPKVEKQPVKPQLQEPIEPVASQKTVKVEQIQEIDDILENLPTNAENVIEPEVDILPGLEEPIIEENTQVHDIPEVENTSIKQDLPEVEVTQPKRRGRPKKIQTTEQIEEKPKRGRGRPKKVVEPIASEQNNTTQVEENAPVAAPVNLFELGDEDTYVATTPANKPEDMFLPGLDDETLFAEQTVDKRMPIIENDKPETFNDSNDISQEPQTIEQEEAEIYVPEHNKVEQEEIEQNQTQQIPQDQFIPNVEYTPNTKQSAIENINKENNTQLSGTLTRDKKIVAFVGTSKNGTSFLVNNIAELLSQKGINTAILDLTQNRNAYYIYTENEEEIRKTAHFCIDNLRRGNASRNSSTQKLNSLYYCTRGK